MKKIQVTIEKTSPGYSAYADDYPVYTTGEDVKESVKNILEALNFYFEETKGKLTVSKKHLDLSFTRSSDPWTEAFIEELNRRTAEIESGKSKGYTWEEVKAHAKQLIKSR
jgi:predicted RNase H-like HicB family nuclease